MLNTLYPDKPRKHGDRYDSFLIRNADPFYTVIPHIMRNRVGSMIFFEERVDISRLEQFMRNLRKETDMTDLGMLHVMMAAVVRLISLRPALNRYISGRRLYARNHISVSITVKNSLDEQSADTTVKTCFLPTDGLQEVWRKLHEGIVSVKASEQNNNTYQTAKLLKRIPVFFLRFFVFLMWHLDERGMMPKAIYHVSPFHASAYLVDIGSTGIGSIYHHLYDFGNCPIFISIGRKETVLKTDREGHIRSVRTINLRFVVDERICDGFYYAKTMILLRRILRHPETLLAPPKRAAADKDL